MKDVKNRSVWSEYRPSGEASSHFRMPYRQRQAVGESESCNSTCTRSAIHHSVGDRGYSGEDRICNWTPFRRHHVHANDIKPGNIVHANDIKPGKYADDSRN